MNIIKIVKPLLILVLFVISELHSNSIQIGNDTLSGQHIPIEAYYQYSYSQVIYQQSEINRMCQIDSIAWYFVGNTLKNSNVWNIHLGQTLKEEFQSTSDWINDSSLTIVWSDTFETVIDSQWIYFDIDDYSFENTKNLVIA